MNITGYGDSYGENCYYPFYYSGQTYYECADQSGSYPWCATSVYQSSYDYYSYKYCTAEDLGYNESNGNGEANYGEDSTVTGESCVPMTYGGVYYEACTSDTYAWCATSTTSYGGSYSTWAYCGNF